MFIFWAVFTAVAAAGLISYDKNNQSVTVVSSNIDSASQVASVASGVNSSIAKNTLALTPVELAKHNSSASCWLLISGKIYDVTTFLPNHPGEAKTILPACGTDATAAYSTEGSEGKSHSTNANSMLADYFIGNLNQTLKLNSKKTTTTNSTKTNNTTQTKLNSASVVTPTLPTQTVPKITPSTTIALTSIELAKHNSVNSCWLLISGKIYDVTFFISSHPGGAAEILNSCGTDATTAFATQGGTGSHSSSATSMLAAYYIGDLNQTVTTNPANPTTPTIANPNPTLPQSRRDDDDEFDD